MQTRTKAMKGLQKKKQPNESLPKKNQPNEALPKKNQPNEEDDMREADSCLANDIVEEIKSLNPDPKMANDEKTEEPKEIQESKTTEELQKRLHAYRNYTLDTEIPDKDEIDGLRKVSKEQAESEDQRLTKLFEKFGRLFVLDITREIALLRQIKDIQDELEMMEKVFADQKEVIEALDRIIRSMIRSNDSIDDKPVEDGAESIHGSANEYKWSVTTEPDVSDDIRSAVGDEHLFAYEQRGYLDKETQKRKDFMKQAQSIIWQFRHQKQNLPIRTVNRFAEQIKKMNERARNTNKAVCHPHLSLSIDLLSFSKVEQR